MFSFLKMDERTSCRVPTMHNQSDVTWLLRYCAGTYAGYIVEGANVLETVFQGLVLEAG
jgi:hypothetical protein